MIVSTEKTIKFWTDEIHDAILFNRAIKSTDMANALYEIAVFVVNQETFTKDDIMNVISKYNIDFNSLFTFNDDQITTEETDNNIEYLTNNDIITEIDLNNAFNFKKKKDE